MPPLILAPDISPVVEFNITLFVPSGVPYDSNVEPLIFHPVVWFPIFPDVAVIAPLIIAFVALNNPWFVTENGVFVSGVPAPAQKAYPQAVASICNPTADAPPPPLSFEVPISHPPIFPYWLNKYPSEALT